LTAIEAVQMCSLLPSLRSAVHTVGLGLLHGFEPLVLAAGHPGHRHLLPHALISIGGLEVEGVPQLPNGTVGLAHHHQGLSLREQAKAMITTQIRQLSKDFRLPRDLWTNPRVITAAQAVQVGLADALVPSINPQRIPKFEKPHEKETALAPTQP
jgi:ATP-dependent protease ClpP protease subunit